MTTFGNRLKQSRLQSNLTLEELANKIGTTKSAISRYENDLRMPNGDFIKSAADTLNVSTDYLLGRVDDPDVIKVSGDKLPKELRDVGVKYIEMAKSMEDKDMSIEDIEQIIKMLEIQKILEEEENKKE